MSLYPAAAAAGTVICLAALYRAIMTRRSALRAAGVAMWAGFWFYAVTIHWVGEALVAAEPAGMSARILALAGSLGCTAIFFPWWGLAAFFAKLMAPDPARGGLYAFVAFWGLADFLLGEFVYGIPLGSLSLVVLDTPLQGLLPVLGTHGANLALVWAGAALGTLGLPAWRHGSVSVMVITLGAVAALGGWIDKSLPGAVDGGSGTVALVQLNMPVPIGMAATGFDAKVKHRILSLTRAGFERGANLVAFPETTFLSDPTSSVDGGVFLSELRAAIPPGKAVILGGRSVETQGALGAPGGFSVATYNTAFIVPAQGPVEHYRKTYLAVFGEYMPGIFRVMGFDVIGGPIGGLTSGTGLRRFTIAGLPPLTLTICYESLMSVPVRRSARAARWVLNISNEYVFGRSIGAALIEQYNRMRSAELGLPMLRATMTGYSGSIDARGDVISAASPYIEELKIAKIPMSFETPFRSLGYAATYSLIMVFLAAALRSTRTRRRPWRKG